jgi:hypothetical protein
LAERQRDRQRMVWRLGQGAREKDEREKLSRQFAKLKALLHEVLAEARAEVANQNATDMKQVHELADGQRAEEKHSQREQIRRLRGKLDRLRDTSWNRDYLMESEW